MSNEITREQLHQLKGKEKIQFICPKSMVTSGYFSMIIAEKMKLTDGRLYVYGNCKDLKIIKEDKLIIAN